MKHDAKVKVRNFNISLIWCVQHTVHAAPAGGLLRTLSQKVTLHDHVFWRHLGDMDTCDFQSGNKKLTIFICLCPGSRAVLQCEWLEWTRTKVGLVPPVVTTATTQSTKTKPQGEFCYFLCPFFISKSHCDASWHSSSSSDCPSN